MKKIDDFELYNMSGMMADRIWEICTSWAYFPRITVGQQICRAADSVCANIAEGFGRFYLKENLGFLYYARGSLEETRHWLVRALNRKLIDANQHSEFMKRIELMGRKLNACINAIKRQLKERGTRD